MRRRRTIRVATGVLVIASAIGLVAGTAFAKGARDVTITGPGLAAPVHLDTTSTSPSGTPAPSVGVNELADATGAFFAVFRTVPTPLERQRPVGSLGPRYRIVYQLYTGQDKVTPVRQDVYPFAHAGFVTYTPSGQRAFDKTVRSGWYTSAVHAGPFGGGMTSEAAIALFVSAGVPDRRTAD
jgi:hypothetical protein